MSTKNNVICEVTCHNGKIECIKHKAELLKNRRYVLEDYLFGSLHETDLNKYEFGEWYFTQTGNIMYIAYCEEDQLDRMIDTLKQLTKDKIADIKQKILSLEEEIENNL